MPYLIPTLTVRELAVDAVTVSTGTFDGAKIRLFGNNITPSVNTTLADLTEITLTGYTTGGYAIVWSAVIIGADGNVHMTAPSQLVECTTAPDAPVSAYGAYIVGDPAGTPFLIAAIRFDAPAVFTDKYDGTVVDIDVPLTA